MRVISPRDVLLVLLGASCMHLFSHISSFLFKNPIVNVRVSTGDFVDQHNDAPVFHEPSAPAFPNSVDPTLPAVDTHHPSIELSGAIPPTSLIKHAPGWTIYEDVYMSNGTFYIVTDTPDAYPDISLMTSTGLAADATPENSALRMPTHFHMDFVTPEQAQQRWGAGSSEEPSRLFTVDGSTLLFNDPSQFLDHYYHFCAELLFGTWAFWAGTFSSSSAPPPTFTRAIFTHTDTNGWRDKPGMNGFFLRAAFPSLTVETAEDWKDRVAATTLNAEQVGSPQKSRAWRFERLLFADRSAAFRGPQCGLLTQRTASEAMLAVAPLDQAGAQLEFMERGWWDPVRRAVLRFIGAPLAVADLFSAEHSMRVLPPSQVVVTYISRQKARRHLIDKDHDGLVLALEELSKRRGWELQVVAPETMAKEEQLELAARTTYLVGVHGNGLSHLIMMPPTPAATVFEIFYPEGYAHDYEWTARALGIRHFAIWNDTSRTFPEVTWPNYPEGFQGESIPVHGPYIAQLIEGRADGRL